MKKITQNDRILEYLKSHKGITSIEAYDKFGCTRLSARIADLKDMGYPIGKTMIDVTNRYGVTLKVARYFLVG